MLKSLMKCAVGPIRMCGIQTFSVAAPKPHTMQYFEIIIAFFLIFFKGTRAGTAPKAWSLGCLLKKGPFRLLYNQGCPAVDQFPTDRFDHGALGIIFAEARRKHAFVANDLRYARLARTRCTGKASEYD